MRCRAHSCMTEMTHDRRSIQFLSLHPQPVPQCPMIRPCAIRRMPQVHQNLTSGNFGSVPLLADHEPDRLKTHNAGASWPACRHGTSSLVVALIISLALYGLRPSLTPLIAAGETPACSRGHVSSGIDGHIRRPALDKRWRRRRTPCRSPPGMPPARRLCRTGVPTLAHRS
jgi:hypothetical protein